MTEMFCRQCGDRFHLSGGPRFCSNCGTPLPLSATELAAVAADLYAVHTAILAAVANLTCVEIAQIEGEGAWTRIDPTGYSIVAWFRRDEEKAGVHGIETSPLRGGGFSLTSTADKEKGRRVTISSVAELPTILPSLLDN